MRLLGCTARQPTDQRQNQHDARCNPQYPSPAQLLSIGINECKAVTVRGCPHDLHSPHRRGNRQALDLNLNLTAHTGERLIIHKNEDTAVGQITHCKNVFSDVAVRASFLFHPEYHPRQA